MNLIRVAIDRPVAVTAAIIMVVLFGVVALARIPIQLAPDVVKPVITISTNWPGAAPAEIERELIIPQEEVLKNLEGLDRMKSSSKPGEGQIELTFSTGQNMDRALLLVANRLDQVSGYPAESDEPRLSTSSNDDNAIAWFVITRLPGNEREIATYGDFAEDTIKAQFERVPGVSRVDVFGGVEGELQIIVDPQRMARYGLTVPAIVDTLRASGISLSAGDVDEGKRRYVVRTEGEFETPEDVEAVLLRTTVDEATGRLGRVTVADIGEVRYGFKERVSFIRQLGEPALVARAIREAGANVIETMDGIREAVVELNAGALPQAGLRIEQAYDETVYINSAIDLVVSNIYVGGALAAVVLLLFLRSIGVTLIVSLAIPVSVVGSFVAMAALGRSINVISLAGIAFAVGMVVDAAIVVVENIFRLRQEGRSAAEAAYEGARQVWGAIFVSALTTVMVFIPILVMELEVGQLFRDIAVAISVAVLLSLVVAITLIPALARRVLGGIGPDSLATRRIPILDSLAGRFVWLIMGFTRRVVANRALALLTVVTVTSTTAWLAWSNLPKLEYLPEGNRNLIFGFIIPPPGYNLATMGKIAERIEEATRPYWATETGPISEPGEPPKFERFFFVALRGNILVGGSSVEPGRAAELIPIVRGPVFEEPGTFGFIRQPSLFGRGIGGARSIDFDITGPDLEGLIDIALRATGLIGQHLPREAGHQFRPDPGLELGAPEIRLVPDRVRLADAGVSARNLALTVDAFNDGVRVDELTVGGEELDLTLKGPAGNAASTQEIDALPIVTESGEILPAGSLARIEVTAGPTEIKHIERERTVSLIISPAATLPLEQALEILETEVIAPLRTEGLPPGVSIALSGTADQLTETFDAMVIDLALAVVIVYLVMAVLFESFLYPLVIMFAVPLAAAGGVAGLWVLNLFKFQALDMLTLLGFVILIGIVVNNAILLVHQTLLHRREEGMSPPEAILAATRNRLRPIFMSTLTSVFGMSPLVLFPGAGSELYRGLGSVVVGGLALSALLTLFLIPPMLSLVMGEGRTITLRARCGPLAPAPAE